MTSSTPQQVQQTTTSTPSPQAQQLIGSAMPFAGAYAAGGGTQLPDWSPVAQFDPSQIAGQNMALGAAGNQYDTARGAEGAYNFLTSGAALDPSTNPGLAASIAFAQKPIYQNLEENVLPKLRTDATGVGQFGSSRDQIAEGLATRGAEQAAGSVGAQLTNQNYQNALDQMTRALGLTPTVQGAEIAPAATTSGVGDVRQALDQSNLSYLFQHFLFPQENLLSTAQALAGLGAGIPGGTNTGTMTMPGPSLLSQLMGMGALGASLFGSGGMFGAGSGGGAFKGAFG